MSVNTYKKSFTLGDYIASFTKNVLPYMFESLDDFQAVEPYQFNQIARSYLDHKRELTLNPNAMLTGDEVKALYNKFVKPDYYTEFGKKYDDGIEYAKKYVPKFRELMDLELSDEDMREFYEDMPNFKQEIDQMIDEAAEKYEKYGIHVKPKNNNYEALPLGSVENYESDFNGDLNVEMREIPDDEYINVNPYFNNFDDDDQGESVALYDDVVNLDNIDSYETEDNINFTTMEDYMKNVEANFTDLKQTDFVQPTFTDYLIKYRLPIGIALGILTPIAIRKTYKWYKNRMNSGTEKTSKEQSTSEPESGANIEDKMKINRLINGGSINDPITNAKIHRLAMV